MNRTHRTPAFTLIELLIVVAIIAILAAIAVPNFLTAQIRAKTARVQEDFHTFFLAVEAYRVDNGLFSASDVQSSIHSHASNQHHFFTTPISYMSKEMYDPFYDHSGHVWNCVGGDIYTLVWGLYHLEPMVNGGVVPGWLPAADVLTRAAYKSGKQYLTLSVGPGMMDFVVPGRGRVRGHDLPCGVVYDLSNGVLSPGEIVGFGP